MKARWHGAPFLDHSIRKWLIALELDEAPVVYDQTKDKDLNVEIKIHRNKRSLNANSYFHVLVEKIADERRVSHTEIHNFLICEYGCLDEDMPPVIMDDEVPWMRLETLHIRPTSATKVLDNGRLYRVYLVMRGSHTYDTKEMSRLIDGAVYEAKQLGIEVLPPDELERMKATWERKA